MDEYIHISRHELNDRLNQARTRIKEEIKNHFPGIILEEILIEQAIEKGFYLAGLRKYN
jgi:hypothetical protein